MKDTLGVILAGGKGQRLYPLTRDRAKPAVPFGGVYRIIDFTISNCLNSELRDVIVLTQYKSQSLTDHINIGWYIGQIGLGSIRVIPPQHRVSEDWYNGTADAVFQNLYEIRKKNPDNAVILSGDHIYKMDYSKMLEFHSDKEAELTVSAIEVDINKASSFGVIEVDKDDKIIGFEEKPAQPKPIPDKPSKVYASMGIYTFGTKTLERELEKDANDPSSGHDFGKNIIPNMIKGGKVYAYNFGNKYWKDVGTIDAYFDANIDLLERDPKLNLYNSWPIHTSIQQAPPAKIHGKTIDTIISGGCIIDGEVKKSILSPNVIVEGEVCESILMDNVKVPRGCKITRAIIDKDNNLPKLVIGCNPEEEIKKLCKMYNLEEDDDIYISPCGIMVIAKGVFNK